MFFSCSGESCMWVSRALLPPSGRLHAGGTFYIHTRTNLICQDHCANSPFSSLNMATSNTYLWGASGQTQSNTGSRQISPAFVLAWNLKFHWLCPICPLWSPPLLLISVSQGDPYQWRTVLLIRLLLSPFPQGLGRQPPMARWLIMLNLSSFPLLSPPEGALRGV